jgi:hypothetical protein
MQRTPGQPADMGSPNSALSVRRLWRVACLPVLMVLVILEPLVTFVLAALALLVLLTTLFFYFLGLPKFPVWTMLALSLGFAIALVPYHALIRMLSDRASPARPRNIIGGQ